MSAGPLVIVGDLLLDRDVIGEVERLCPEAPVPVLAEKSTVDRPGGAGLAALFAAYDDGLNRVNARREVVLIAPVSDDEAGERARELVAEAGVRLVALPLLGRISPVGAPPREALAAVAAAGAILASDYGRGAVAQPQLHAALAKRAGRVPLVWDPHPRGGPPVAGARLVTPNRAEAARFADAMGYGSASGPAETPGFGAVAGESGFGAVAETSGFGAVASHAVYLRRCWGARAVAVTLAERGAALADEEQAPLMVPTTFAAHGDPCGAGDRFASTAVAVLADGGSAFDAVATAVAVATAYVAAGGALALLAGATGATAPGSPADLQMLAS